VRQGPSPGAATRSHFADLGLDLVPGSGPLAATVAGAFGAWTTLLQRWGTWELADVLGYALHYAEQGFPVLAAISDRMAAVRDLFVEHWTPSAATWLDADLAGRGQLVALTRGGPDVSPGDRGECRTQPRGTHRGGE
jgi:gamma-glutamyltranspeptidase